jgi:hypothetical protein
MKVLMYAASLALAASTAHAQSAPSPATPASGQQLAQARAAKTRDRAAARKRIDHSMDRLVVEPTHSSITLTVPSPIYWDRQSRQ